MGVVAQQLHLPQGYGSPSRTLEWPAVVERLVAAPNYWIATVRPDGRPHAVPKDGLWHADALFFGGSTETVNHRNLTASGLAAAHIGDGREVVSVEGVAEWVVPSDAEAKQLAAASRGKYGYAPPVSAYKAGTWRLRPQRVVAWTEFPKDATRFLFT